MHRFWSLDKENNSTEELVLSGVVCKVVPCVDSVDCSSTANGVCN